jgi:hypothetical protein
MQIFPTKKPARLSHKDIERRQEREEKERRKRAEDAANRITDDYIRRGKRIQKLGANGHAAFAAAQELAEEIARQCGKQAAVDIFENIAHIWRSQIPKRPPGKQAGPHDPEGDKFLVALYDMVRNGEAPGQTRPWSKTVLAMQLTKTPEGRKRWGRPSQIVRRLEVLINERNKRESATPTK